MKLPILFGGKAKADGTMVIESDRRSIVAAMRDIASPVTETDVPDSAIGPIIAGVVVMLIFFGGFVGWAAFAPLASAVVAAGTLKIEGNRKSIQHLDGGIVSEIKVTDGDEVQPGQVLVQLDDTRARADYTSFTQQYDSLRAQEARLTAESTGAADVVFPADMKDRVSDPTVSAAITGQKKLRDARSAALQSQIEMSKKRIAEYQVQMTGDKAQIAARVAQRQSMEKELKGLKDLYEKGIISQTRVLDLQRNAERLEGEENELTADMGRAEQSINQTKSQTDAVRQEWLSQVVNELRDTQTKVSDVYQHMLSAKDVLDRTQIKAPVAGTVFGMTIFTKGAVIPRGETILEIEPHDQQMRVDAPVKPEDIDRIREGMEAEVKLTALKQRDLPLIIGKVTYVSPDRQVEAHTGKPYYTVYVKIDEASLANAPTHIDLYPGMPASIVVATGDRTALQYMIQPLIDSMSAAFRER
ncbi:MAG TPA: HlyD family type I secretion periplasmic adaptor subunit [Magnetospirillaceae bacterium]|jgi:HlyD family type I secretion membrane fusion protein